MSNRSEKLRRLQKLQASHGNTGNEDDDRVYDEVDEKEYRQLKYKELLQDDFVDDDDGLGYVDRGVEETGNDYSSEEEMEENKTDSKKNGANGRTVGDMLKFQKASVELKKTQKKGKDINEFEDILGEYENETMLRPTGKRSIERHQQPSKRAKIEIGSDLGDLELDSSPIKSHTSSKKPDGNLKSEDPKANFPEAPKSSAPQNESTDSDEEDIFVSRRTVRRVPTKRDINLSSKSNPFTSPPPDTPQTSSIGDSQSQRLSSPSSSKISTDKLDEDDVVDSQSNTFQMYWLDFCEVDNTLVLFGKVKTRDGSLVSGMVQINGICRELYFLPREGRTPQDIHDEIIPLLMEKYGLDNIRAKTEKMKYAFELPDIPHETDYLKVLMPMNTPKCKYDTIPSDLSSDNFYHVFGGKSGAFENFVIQNKIMGPCWLEIKDGNFSALQNASNCSVELAVDRPQNVRPLDVKDMPELNGISIAIQTVMNVEENKQEIVALTLSTYKGISIGSPIPEDLQPNDVTTLLRPPVGSKFPSGLRNIASEKLKGQVRFCNNEKILLSCFCALLLRIDPDILIGHRLESLQLDVLVHRLHELNIPTFSALGRRARRAWPDRFGKNNFSWNHFFVQELIAGRLLCDIANDMGQSLTPKCQTWDLPEMYFITCGKETTPLDINYQNLHYREDADTMAMALRENIKNSLMIAEISFRIQLLSLTKQLTNLAGNAWSQTLAGTRAGRNEYILLHEFSRNGYILPDKENSRNRNLKKLENGLPEGESNNRDPVVSSKKAKYQGGLVFEPEKGLHKNYVLVMDFNSLYPSIIQEFNICFTTVERNLVDTDEIPETPPKNSAKGVLPKLLANLVQRRREVKKIMATEKDPHKRSQCDIKQQALKLTANSMYGCLGYVHSRFYAKPLAMLVTNKGREILMNTRQLAESLDLTVVYGDTDSVMIDSKCDNYADAIGVGNNFKKLVNERYKLLEIDVDNVFKRLLLHAKKKYAALNVSLDSEKNERTVLDVKGLDMKRREFCPLARDVSVHVLNTLLSQDDSEKALFDIYEYLERTRAQMENNEIRIDKYKINTKLSKDPNSYPNGKSMPAVQVALRMRKAGRVVKAGTVITFVITKEDKPDDSVAKELPPVPERARPLNEVMIKSNHLKPDAAYYLEKQLFAPVERLLERIESFDIVRLIQSLGLHHKRYLNKSHTIDNGAGGIGSLQPLEATIPDAERFRDVQLLRVTCPQCDHTFHFGGIVPSNHYAMCYNGLQCKHCNHIFTPLQLTCQLERSIRLHISLYYAGWVQCDDATCSNSIRRQISVFGKRCLNDGCTGVVHYRYTDKLLYNQLLYFDSLFDCEKNKHQLLRPLYLEGDPDFPREALTDSTIRALSEQNREYLDIGRGIVHKYLSDCGRRYVDMGSIFDFMAPIK